MCVKEPNSRSALCASRVIVRLPVCHSKSLVEYLFCQVIEELLGTASTSGGTPREATKEESREERRTEQRNTQTEVTPNTICQLAIKTDK